MKQNPCDALNTICLWQCAVAQAQRNSDFKPLGRYLTSAKIKKNLDLQKRMKLLAPLQKAEKIVYSIAKIPIGRIFDEYKTSLPQLIFVGLTPSLTYLFAAKISRLCPFQISKCTAMILTLLNLTFSHLWLVLIVIG